jgi:hypothetical protein
MKHQIHPSLVPLAVPIAGLTPDPRNARLHNERNIVSVMDSYREHGQRKPIVVQKKTDAGLEMVVRAGNGQLEAAKRLGWTHLAVTLVDEEDKKAIAFALRDNRTGDLAEWNYEVIAMEMAAYEHDGQDFTQFGWTSDELAPLRETTWFQDAKGSLEEHSRSFPGSSEGGGKGATIVTVRGEDEADLQKVATLMREKFREKQMNLGRIVGRLARHYMATMTHSAAESAPSGETSSDE